MQVLEREIILKKEEQIIDIANFRIDMIDNCRLSIRMKKKDTTIPKTGKKLKKREDVVINFTREETEKIKRCLK